MKLAVSGFLVFALAGCGLFDSGTGNGNGNNPPGTATTLEGAWRGTRLEVQYLDGTIFKTNSAGVQFPFDEGLLDRGTLDQYIQIAGSTLVTYSFFSKDAFYTKLTQALSCSSRSCAIMNDGLLTAIGASSTFELDDGNFTQRTTFPILTPMQGTFSLATVVYDSYGGSLPPSAWPTTVMELN